MKRKSVLFMIPLLLLLTMFHPISQCFAQEIHPDLYKGLKYRYIGPPGNRVSAVTGIPENPNIYYIGAASGGVFRTTDGGTHWEALTDSLDVSSIGSLAIAPSDQNVIWAGTGETFIRSNISVGNGIYKSTDAGRTWEQMGLGKTGRIGRIVIDPRNPDVVFAAALGHCYGPQQERGVFRTKDGGKTWERVLFVDEKTGCADIAMDPNNSRILFAGMWENYIKTYERNSGGPGSGIFVSRDGGDTWKRLKGNGLPKSPVGKIGMAIAPTNSNKIYALIETAQFEFKGVLWRSDDGGRKWKLISYDKKYTQRPFYYSRCVVDPRDEDRVYFCAHGVWVSTDGGKTSRSLGPVGGDDHDMWVNPMSPENMIVGNDGSAPISVTGGKTWFKPVLPIAQMYHVYTDNQVPYNVYGNRQDGPSAVGPSNSRLSNKKIPSGMWHSFGGFECGFGVPDPVDNNIVWSGSYDGGLDVYDARTRQARNVSPWPDDIDGWPPAPLKYRFNWTLPIAISPHDHHRVYVGSQYVHQTTDGGSSWTLISSDLTTNDKSRQIPSGNLTIDNGGMEFGCTLFALAESSLEEGVIWAGSNDGLVHITRDGGKNWENVTDKIPNLPEWGTISNIEPSRYDAGTCYITVDFHQMNNRDPFVYKATEYGRKWKSISGNIPKSMLSYAHCVREDPQRQGMLYLGTENAVYVTYNDGKEWMALQNNLPHAPVHWLTVQEHFSDLVIGTYGRGFWILDDITPIRQMTDEIVKSDVHLFEPRAAYRFQPITSPMDTDNPSTGKNPTYGASINYYLNEATKDTVYISITDAKGDTIRTIKGKKGKGLNRVHWDLRHKRATEPKLRTPPLGHPGVEYGPERLRYDKKKYWRKLITWGNGGFKGPLAVPGEYTVHLQVGEKNYATSLEVRKDPNTSGTLEEINAQVAMLLEIRDNIAKVCEMINKLEWIRKQIDDVEILFKSDKKMKTYLAAADSLDKKCIAIEKELFQLELTGKAADVYRGPVKLYAKLMRLATTAGQGDFPPTHQHKEVHAMFKEMIGDLQKRFDDLEKSDVAAFNKMLADADMFNIIIPQIAKEK